MTGHVAVVTDSTAYLPSSTVQQRGITVVPLQVVIDGQSLAEGVQVDSHRVAEALISGAAVTTSRPSSLALTDTYRRLQGEGAASIVSLHLSGDISGTVDAARTAARDVAADGLHVEVVDSRSLGMGLGFAVLTAAELAAAGLPVEQVAHRAALRALDSSAFLYVDTLEYLRRGGRISAAQARFGTALAVKPLLHLVDGRLESLDKVRTTNKALSRLVEVAVAEAGDRQVDVAVHHLAAKDRAEEVAERLRKGLKRARDVYVGEVGAVVGAHAGPGMVAVVVSPL